MWTQWFRLFQYRAMPTPRAPDPPVPQFAAMGNNCPNCGLPMRLAAIAPHFKFTNLDVRHFVCDCGETESYMVARAAG